MIYQAKTAKNLEEFNLGLASESEDNDPFIDDDKPSFIEDDEPLTSDNKLIGDEDEDESFSKKQGDKNKTSEEMGKKYHFGTLNSLILPF